ncbi:hypothetical protein ACJ2A9_04935 [Anaerobacillus sp. MEB173]|uniref:hypothetical protein n=1 Tax=Anaerobacillus sp. MEB173 TaxID=3383345 RepID=UPI003F8EFC5F
MKIENLGEGQILKNYKELCEVLEVSTKTGNAKKAQLKELERHFKYHKQGHKYIIEEIYDSPKEKKVRRGNNDIFNSHLQKLFMEILLSHDRQVINITRNRLLKSAGMINENYVECSDKVTLLHDYSEVDKKIIYDFYNITRGSFKKLVESVLDNLQKQSLLTYKVITIVCIREDDEDVHRPADLDELEIISDCEESILKQMNYEKLSEVRVSSHWHKFKKEAKKLLHDQSDINYYYLAYEVTLNEKMTSEYDNSQLIHKEELNQTHTDKLLVNAEKRHEKSKLFTSTKKIDRYRRSKSYIDDFEKLTNILITYNKPNLIQQMKEKQKQKLEEEMEDIKLLELFG